MGLPKTRRLVTPRRMWIALYVGSDGSRERKITNGEAWSTKEQAEEWMVSEYGDYAHEYRLVQYRMVPGTNAAQVKK